MAWSKVIKMHKKPIKWWYHKVMCEFCYYMAFRKHKLNFFIIRTWYGWYYYHLNKLCKKGFNLYGEKYTIQYKNRDSNL